MTSRRTALPFRATLSTAAFLLAANLLTAPALAQKDTKSAPPRPTPDHAAAYYHTGLAHLYEQMAVTNGRPDYATQAVEEYKLALNADPDSKFLQDGLADLYFKIGRIREAVTAAQDQVKKNPDDLAAHTLLGHVYLRSLNDMQGTQANDMLQLAIGEYEKIAALSPKVLENHLVLGQLYAFNRDTAKAEEQFKLAEGIDAGSEEAVLQMAHLYSEQGEPLKAVQALNAIPEKDRSPRINFALGASYDELKSFKKAAAAYKSGLEDEPENLDAQRALATDLLNTNQLTEALAVLQIVAKADPSDAKTLMKISEIERSQGHLDEALESVKKAKALGENSNHAELAFQEAVLDDSLGKYDQAINTLQTELVASAHLDRHYSEPEAHNRAIFLNRLAAIYNEQNRTTDAIATYKQMIELGGDYVIQGYEGEIETYRAAHQWKDALGASAELAKLYPTNSRVQLNWAMNLADTGDAQQSLKIANAQLTGTLAAPKPEDRETLYNIAIIDLRLRRSSDAITALDKADSFAKLPEDHLGIYLLKATVLDHDKQFDGAEAQYKKALVISPDNATVLNDFGYMLADRGVRLQEALDMIKKAVDAEPQNGSYLDSLGWVYFKLGQFAPAEENLKKAIDREPADGSIHDHLAEVYAKTNRLQLAVAQWERAMTEYAHSLPADADPADVAKVKQKLDEARTKLARVSSTSNKKS
jgi:tetratricopeptide (TPR) repeat protein